MYEERRLAKEGNYPDPINDTLEDTANMYHKNAEYIIKNKSPKSQLLVASHNTASVRKIQHLLSPMPDSIKKTISFA